MFRSKVRALIQQWNSFEAEYVHVQDKGTDTTVGKALRLSLFRSKLGKSTDTSMGKALRLSMFRSKVRALLQQ